MACVAQPNSSAAGRNEWLPSVSAAIRTCADVMPHRNCRSKRDAFRHSHRAVSTTAMTTVAALLHPCELMTAYSPPQSSLYGGGVENQPGACSHSSMGGIGVEQLR